MEEDVAASKNNGCTKLTQNIKSLNKTYHHHSSRSATEMRLTTAVLLIASASAFSPTKHASSPTHAFDANSALFMADGEFDFDVAIIGCGVGGHGAALHSRGQGLSTGVFAGGDVGGTCVNRGCVPSKALLAASGRVRDMKDSHHLESLGIEVDGEIKYSRQGIADHAKNLATRVKGNLENSLIGLGCDVVEGRGVLTGNPHEVKDSATGKVYRAKVRKDEPVKVIFVLPICC